MRAVTLTYLFLFFYFYAPVISQNGSIGIFLRWPNAVVPFYIEKEHFDADQATYIRTTLSLLAYKTCLKFLPVLTKPGAKQHVMVFQNPGGMKKCDVSNAGNSVDDPHYVNLGYECLRSPQIEMKLFQALGFPFEHNRPMRDVYIDVQPENVESGYLEIFTKDEDLLPQEMQVLPYDLNSVSHFGERDFSRNGHRTIIIKDPNVKQQRNTFTETDLRKIEIVYGKECLNRDRQEKVEMCQHYPGVARKKRSTDIEINGRKILQDTNLRVNRNIKPMESLLQELEIDSGVNATIDALYKLLSLAFKNAVKRYCESNNTENVNTYINKHDLDLLDVKTAVTKLAVKMVDFVKNDKRLCTKPELTDAILKEKLNSDLFIVTKSPNNELVTVEPNTRRSYDKLSEKESAESENDNGKTNEGDSSDNNNEKSKETTSEVQDDWTPVIVNLTDENKGFYDDRKWPNGVVWYLIEDDDKYDIEDLKSRLEDVNKILKKKTCTRLEKLRDEDEGKRRKNYLIIDTSPDYITGKVGGRQQFGSVELFEGGQHLQHTAMMVMAMLGFYFEVARHDRDQHIRVHYRHIRPNKLHHFEKIREEATFQLPYDYESAAHPAWQFWRKADKTGISSVATYKNQDPNGKIMKSLGQHSHLLSELDIVKINSVYGVECFKDKLNNRRLNRRRS